MIQSITAGILSIGAIALGYVALMNLASCLPKSLWPRFGVLSIGAMLCFGGPTLYLVLVGKRDEALIVASVEGYVGALVSYFLGQRFESPVMRSTLVLRKPTFFPTAALIYFSFSASFLGIAGGWLWAILPIFIWATFGITSVELALRREQMRLAEHGREPSRGNAVFMLNEYQGRTRVISLFEPSSRANRYPFP